MLKNNIDFFKTTTILIYKLNKISNILGVKTYLKFVDHFNVKRRTFLGYIAIILK